MSEKSPSQFTGKVEACWNSMFNGIECLVSNSKFGFFKDDNDIRPSQCTWIKKEDCEKLWNEFRNQTIAEVLKIIDKSVWTLVEGRKMIDEWNLKEEIGNLKVGK